MKRCPLCERVWPQSEAQPPLWQKLMRYADGTHSYRELAKLVGSTPGGVSVALSHMRRAGLDVKGRVKLPLPPLERSEHEELRHFREEDGLTWRQIAKRRGISEAGVFKRAKKLEAMFGRLPQRLHRKHGARRDPARDYVRIRAHRVDAGWPWKLVGADMGMSGQYVAQYFRGLCKTYGNAPF
jgi:hypothetical protein